MWFVLEMLFDYFMLMEDSCFNSNIPWVTVDQQQ